MAPATEKEEKVVSPSKSTGSEPAGPEVRELYFENVM